MLSVVVVGKKKKLYLKNATQLVCVCNNKQLFLRGTDMNSLVIIEDGSVVVGADGTIEAVGTAAQVAASYPDESVFETVFDATGKAVIPGLVDAHTHPVWSGDRVHEFTMKLAGATYLDIHKAGGGIAFTVGHTRRSSESELRELLLQRMDRMLAQGTTLMEGKSGYGLDTETEMKQLKVMHSVKGKHPVELVSTFLGAHSVPKDTTADKQTDYIINDMLPALVALKTKGEISPEFVDVFMEEGVFNYDQTRRILEAGKAVGLDINFHGDELHYVRSGELGGEIGALAISHLEKVSEEGMKAMAKRPTFAVLLPSTAFILKIAPPPAKLLMQNEVPVVLASDYNPNAHCLSLPMVMNLGCILMGMTMPQALIATTINAAAAINKSATHGSLEVGKVGDLVVVDAATWEHLVYEMGDPPVHTVFKRGVRVWSKAK